MQDITIHLLITVIIILVIMLYIIYNKFANVNAEILTIKSYLAVVEKAVNYNHEDNCKLHANLNTAINAIKKSNNIIFENTVDIAKMVETNKTVAPDICSVTDDNPKMIKSLANNNEANTQPISANISHSRDNSTGQQKLKINININNKNM